MKKSLFFTLWLALAAVFLFTTSGKAAEADPTEIRIGCNAPLTGMFAGFGTGGAWGVKAAVEDINKLGGVSVKKLGKKLPVKLFTVDNESDPG